MAKKKKANGNGGALIYMVLDKSGSMEYRRNDTIEGCNRFLGETREADPEARFSLLLFDTSVTKVHEGKPLTEIEPIDGHVYSPGGGTALLDAVGHAVKDIEEMKDAPSKVVIAVFTDGQENPATSTPVKPSRPRCLGTRRKMAGSSYSLEPILTPSLKLEQSVWLAPTAA